MRYEKKVSIFGDWAKGKDIMSGIKAVLTEETRPIKSQFKDKNGNEKMQDVSKIKLENKDEELNINLNRATIDGLIDAFGEDSKDWINKLLTIQTERVSVGGKRLTVIYLVPSGYELRENEDGYIKIVKFGNIIEKTEKEINAELDEIADENYQ